jgi:hypothetical protein
MPVIIFIFAVVLIGLAAYLSYYMKQKRRSDLQAMARQLGLQYSGEDIFDLLAYPFDLFTRGDGRGTENVMSGTWSGLDLREFDYWYYEESSDGRGGRTRTYYRFSCVIARISAACSHLSITHENVLQRAAGHLGFEDIQFELEDFNREFYVRAKDRKFANDLIDQRMMQWLLTTGGRFGFETLDNQLLVFVKRLAPNELIPLLGNAKAFLDHVPRVVAELYPLVPPSPGH